MTSFVSTADAFRYHADIGFENSKAFKFINKAFGIELKSNTDEYKCADYELTLDYNVAYVYFKKLNKPFIRGIMHKIADALREDKDCWSLYEEKYECEIDIHAETYEIEEDEVLEVNSDTYVDAHPQLSSRDHEKWVGSKVNEPLNGESFNCVFGDCVSRLPGEWEPHLVPCGLVLCVVRSINKGEELTALYGWSSRYITCCKSVGYTPSFDIPLLPPLLHSQ
jgi:hypothetical protein